MKAAHPFHLYYADAAHAGRAGLGAKGTMIGRAYIHGLGAMGEAGATAALEVIRTPEDQATRKAVPVAANANAPEPTTSYKIATALKHVSKGFSVALPAPSFVLSLALARMSTALTDSTRCSSDKIRKAGYVFQYEDLEAVLKLYTV